ncbi:MAG: hypothetical protein AAFV80_08820 [Bacteroidota bacterium]
MKSKIQDRYYPLAAKFEFDTIQEVFSVSYIVLLLCGMIMDYTDYAIYGVNIFSYSNILDFLLSPFKRIEIVLPVAIVFAFSFFRQQYAIRKATPEEIELLRNAPRRFSIYFEIIMTISLVIGFSIGNYLGGKHRVQNRIEEGYSNSTLEMIDGSTQDIYLFGKNNSYLFFFSDQETEMKIMPIPNNVKVIQVQDKE